MPDAYKKLKPKYEGSIIRDPVTKIPLAEDGELKPWIGNEGTYWRRRFEEGSCIVCEESFVKTVSGDDIDKKGGKK